MQLWEWFVLESATKLQITYFLDLDFRDLDFLDFRDLDLCAFSALGFLCFLAPPAKAPFGMMSV